MSAEPRNAEQVDLQAWSDFLAESQLDPERKRHLNAPDVRFARAAYEAGAASRQGEVDRLRKVLEMLEIDLVDPITGNCDICKQSNIYGRHWECGFAELEKTGG